MIIYFKLGVGITTFSDESLGIYLSTPSRLAIATDLTNTNANIYSALLAGIIIQINEQEYYTILGATPPVILTPVNTNYLFTLSTELQECPAGTDTFFLLKENRWFRVSWTTMKNCINQVSLFLFRVGQGGLYRGTPIPNDGDTTYQNDELKNRDITLTVNGIRMYPSSVYDPADLPEIDYYLHDKDTGIITRPYTFKNKEIIQIN